ncbi:MAG TPA: error-prone DNA polymerase, partial [Rhodocyclaceae bacterium]
SCLRRSFDLLKSHYGEVRSLSQQDEDGATYAMIQRADTIGVFQIESRAQMAMLPRLKPREFYDLVIEVAIVRPGPIQGDMVHPYLRRRQGKEAVSYPSDAVRDVLKRTLGVPIFQEQAMQIAIVAAGFTPGEADQLRRAMAAWKRKGGLAPFKEKLLSGMAERRYAPEFAEALFRQIEGFGEYGFPESHAASFALLAYASAWLKCHEPAAFLLGLLNALPMGFYSASQLVQDARRHGVEVLPPDVSRSHWETTLEGAAVRLGLQRVRGLAQGTGERIAAARAVAPFFDSADLARRAGLARRDLDLLVEAGGLVSLIGHRRQAAWAGAAVPLQQDLLLDAPLQETELALPAPREGEDLIADYVRLGLSLGRHPLLLLRGHLGRWRYATAAALRDQEHRRPARCAGIVTCRQRPGSAAGVIFLTLEDETGLTNVIVHPKLAERQRRELLGARLLGVLGVLQREGEVVHLIAKRLLDHSQLLGELPTLSRDFH